MGSMEIISMKDFRNLKEILATKMNKSELNR